MPAQFSGSINVLVSVVKGALNVRWKSRPELVVCVGRSPRCQFRDGAFPRGTVGVHRSLRADHVDRLARMMDLVLALGIGGSP